MKTTLLVCLVLIFSFGFSKADAETNNVLDSNTTGLAGVKKKTEKCDNLYIEQIDKYSTKKNDCSIMWAVEVDRGDEPKKLTLRARYPIGIECKNSFNEQLDLHRQVFKKIFEDWDKNRFRVLFLPPLEKLEPAYIWNVRIAMASANSADWKDRCKNYPNHVSGKSSNEIFVELANKVNAYKELADLFKEFDLEISLNSVEKVFCIKARELPFYQELKTQGVEGNPSLIYDAGMNYFSVSALD